MKDINILQDLQGLSNETYNEILRLAEKHGKERKDKRPKKPTRRTFGFDDDLAISKVTKYNKWLKKKRALEEDWKGPVFNSKFTTFEAVEAIHTYHYQEHPDGGLGWRPQSCLKKFLPTGSWLL